MEILVNKNDSEVILLKEDIKASKCSFGINLLKEGLLLENVDNNETLHSLKMIDVVQTKKVLGDTISANRINKSRAPSLQTIEELDKPKKRRCEIF